jgi:uncharacterized protein (TIGR02145 family)
MKTNKTGKGGRTMKKTLAMLGALLALAACGRKELEPVVFPEENQDIKVNLTIGLADAFEEDPETRATVKKTWDDGDVVFVFFRDIASPKYLEMKYNNGSWTATARNGLTASDLSGAPEKKMLGLYLPYGSEATVATGGWESFTFSDVTYNGIIYRDKYAEPYTYDGELHGELNLMPSMAHANERYVHFDVSGYTKGHTYALYLDPVQSISFVMLHAGIDGANYDMSQKALAGHVDMKRGVLSFSGILKAAAVGKETDYQFSIIDETASVIYTRNAGKHTISKHSAIGLGDLKDASKWTATEFVYLGIDNASGEKICWAKKNLGATAVQGEGSYGNYAAWGCRDSYGLNGTFGNYTTTHVSFAEEEGVSGDPATAALGGLWRLPTEKEFEALIADTDASYPADQNTVDYGMTLTSRVSGYTDKSIFLPAAGYIYEGDLSEEGRKGFYWTSSSVDSGRIYFGFFNAFRETYSNATHHFGMSLRPVFTVPSLNVGATGTVYDPTKINDHKFVDMGNGLGWATENLGTTSENPRGNEIEWEDPDPATLGWGAPWRTPTHEEWQWLLDPENTTWETQIDEHYYFGYRFTSKTTGNSVFIPVKPSWTSWGNAYYYSSTREVSTGDGYTIVMQYMADFYEDEFSADGQRWGESTAFLRPVVSLQ